ncbi:MAG: type VI secretion system baseplate subunit TssE [Planctomycetota bacterium]|nr:type VI secretion system baseplate subunit TssE [Planctomycetota bacterium]
MAELTTTERLQPALLDRLIDDEPDKKTESRDRRVLSMRQLRGAVLRDLEWLLNSNARPMADEIYQFPLAAKSVLNFGLPDLTGLTVSGVRVGSLEKMVFDAITVFEPRIMRRGLSIRALGEQDQGKHHNVIGFEIQGELCPLPMPEALFLKTEVDLETGRCEITDRVRGS